MIEKGLHSLLATDAGVAALIGTRVYPNKAPHNAGQRYVVYRRIMNNARRHLRGSTGLKRATIQIDCVGSTYDQAKELYAAVYAAIGEDGKSGVTWGGKSVKVAYIEDDADDYIPPQTNDDAGVHTVPLDLVVWYVN